MDVRRTSVFVGLESAANVADQGSSLDLNRKLVENAMEAEWYAYLRVVLSFNRAGLLVSYLWWFSEIMAAGIFAHAGSL